ncbi:hypothetical protein C8Q74DRAFT_1232636 [Fomes fomentarius]|nr:hypothetical protein C8Q74DRAFT_1232636 [Fomes fomentarius]
MAKKSRARRFKFVSSERIKLLITTAYSTFHNSRNLEVEYYTAYMLTLDEVANIPGHGALIARQQPTMWLSKENEELLPREELIARYRDGYSDDEGDRDDHPDPSNEARRPNRLREKADAVERAMAEFRELLGTDAEPVLKPAATTEEDVGDLSIATIQTIPDGKATEKEPDGVVCHICVIDVEEPLNDSNARFAWERRHGKKTNHMCFPAMLELKRSPSRPLRDGQLFTMREQLLRQAEMELQLYCSLQFARDQRASEVVAISGAGGWWRWVKFTRDEIPPYPLLLAYRNVELYDEEAEEMYFDTYETSFTEKFDAAEIHYMGSKESDAEWTRLREEGLIPILEAHRTDYPRLFQPPPALAHAANEGEENQAGPSGVANQAAESAAPAPARARRGKRADSPPAAGQTEVNDAASGRVSSRRTTRAAAKKAKANQTGTSAQAGRPTRQAQENPAGPSGVANQAVEPAAPTPATRRRAGGRRANSPRAAGQTEVSDSCKRWCLWQSPDGPLTLGSRRTITSLRLGRARRLADRRAGTKRGRPRPRRVLKLKLDRVMMRTKPGWAGPVATGRGRGVCAVD